MGPVGLVPPCSSLFLGNQGRSVLACILSKNSAATSEKWPQNHVFVELSDSLLVKYPTVPKSMVAAATTAILVPNCCLKPLKWLEYHDILPFLPHVHRSLFSNTLYILWNILDYVFSEHPLYSKRISRMILTTEGLGHPHAHGIVINLNFEIAHHRTNYRI